MNTKIYVINLLKDIERRTYIKTQLDKYGLSYEIFNATNGRELSAQDKALCSFSNSTTLDLYGGRKIILEDALSLGEIGCALSHLRVYKDILDRKLDYAIIMEDDIALNDDTVFAIQNIDCIKEKWDIINFSYHLGIKSLPLVKKYYFNKDRNMYFSQVGMRSHMLNSIFNARRMIGLACLYVVTSKACENLIKLGYPVRMPADYLTGMIAFNNLKVFRPYPVSLYSQQRNIVSSIGERYTHQIRRV